MFRRIAAAVDINRNDNGLTPYEANARSIFSMHPSEIAYLLEMAWSFRMFGDFPSGYPFNRSNISNIPESILNLFHNYEDYRARFNGEILWDHLIYAYLVENTQIMEVFRKVLDEFFWGERLGTPLNDEAQSWLRNTEILFFTDPSPFSVLNINSRIRPDADAYRRNNYYRLFGMDLNHKVQGEFPSTYRRASASNLEFISTFERFLQEVWIGIVNSENSSGYKPTDVAAIANLARKLHNMLMARRQNGNMSQSEFAAVAMMSWFHLTLEFNSPIIESLRADSQSEDQRLFKVAERVGARAHSKSYHFFRLADHLSQLLLQIEQGIFNNTLAVPALFEREPELGNEQTPQTSNVSSEEIGIQLGTGVQTQMREIITHWSLATGREMKVLRKQPYSLVSAK